MKYLRRLHGLTQDQLSRKLGIKRPSIGAYEEGRANPPIDVLKTMSRLFSVSVDDLLKKDLCKIRETPSLIPIDKPKTAPLVSEPAVTDVPSLATIFDQFYTPPTAPSRQSSMADLAPKPPQPVAIPAVEPPKPPVVSYQAGGFPTPPTFNNAFENSSSANIVQAPLPESEKNTLKTVAYVRKGQLQEYIEKFQNPEFTKRLPTLAFPMLGDGHYRAFEAGEDFQYPGALLVGQFVANWYDIADGKTYILVARNLGVVCRRVFNQVKIKGTLLLSSDKTTIPTFEVPLKDVLEAWEIKAFFSTTLPEPTVSLDHLRHLVTQMQEELNRIKK
ncbi:MAG: helix-turn-helix domain-containing protein [Spirosomaceae bacterium]|nr:helix-turn-helix domain-containing protein [Spirosomataceae bacterium]